jgi:hypothetical protein
VDSASASPSPPKMKSAAREDRGRLPRALPIYSGTPAGHTSTGTGGASCLATYNLAYPPFCPYPSVLVALKPISGVVAASPPACLLTCLHSNLFRPTKGRGCGGKNRCFYGVSSHPLPRCHKPSKWFSTAAS